MKNWKLSNRKENCNLENTKYFILCTETAMYRDGYVFRTYHLKTGYGFRSSWKRISVSLFSSNLPTNAEKLFHISTSTITSTIQQIHYSLSS